jgi:small nuclear ribonucleoprotein (snRNP)-like protein
MASYFRNIPNFEYVNRLPESHSSSEYIEVKNLFKRGKIRDDIFKDVTYFTKYSIQGDDRPDNVAFSLYQDSGLDWVVLLANNIINIQDEWPLTQESFENYLLNKYGNEQTIHSIHHYESKEVKNSIGSIILKEGLHVPQYFTLKFLDANLGTYTEVGGAGDLITSEVTNYDYEVNLQNEKRNIYVLKQNYLNIILTDMDRMMPYKTGSTQYVNGTLVRGENIKLYS